MARYTAVHSLKADGFYPSALVSHAKFNPLLEVADAVVTAGADAGTFEVAFALPGGAYATAVMREVMKTVPQRVDDTPEGA